MSKPWTIAFFGFQTSQALIANGLSELCDELDNRPLMKSKLEEKFRALEKEEKPIPEDLDWIYAQYNTIAIIRNIFSLNNDKNQPAIE